jgi:hypothetical protein
MQSRALFIGLNQYQDPGNNLRGCLNDVKNVFDYASKNWGFAPGNDMRAVCDARANTSNIRERMQWLSDFMANSAGNGDRFLWLYSGHGSQITQRDNIGDVEKDGLTEIICPYDLDWDDPITDDEIHSILLRIPEGASGLFLSDSCHSGSLDRDINPSYRAPKFMPPPIDIQLRTANGGTKVINTQNVCVDDTINYVFISGCKDSQTSADATIDGKPCGAMTNSFLRALEADPNATILEVHKRMLDILDSGGFDQIPQLTGPERLLTKPFWK